MGAPTGTNTGIAESGLPVARLNDGEARPIFAEMAKVSEVSGPSGKAEILRHARKAIADPAYLEEVLREVALKADHSWRAAWVLAKMAELGFVPDDKLSDRLIALAEEGEQNTQRSLLRCLLARGLFLEEQEGRLFDLCLRILDTPGVTVSTLGPAFDLSLLVCIRYPELWPELDQRVRRFADTDSNGLKAILRRMREGFRDYIADRTNA